MSVLKKWDCQTAYFSNMGNYGLDENKKVITIMSPTGDVALINNTLDKDMQEAIAQLITMAPDMLKALQSIKELAASGDIEGIKQAALKLIEQAPEL